jgi:hypothetical protein
MKKSILQLLALLLVIVQLTSCNEEIDFANNYIESPVIFGLLDQTDSVHYIKINRGFLGPGNAFTFAQEPDSNYFEKVEAVVEEFLNGSVLRSWTLRDTLLNNKDTNGVFFAPEQKLYYFSTIGDLSLSPDATYRLKVDINDGTLQVAGETRLVNNVALSTNVSSSNTAMRFADDLAEYINVTIESGVGTAVFSNTTMNITIREYRGTATTDIVIPWNIDEKLADGLNVRASAFGETFYQRVRDGVTNDPTITKRNLIGFDYVFTGGSSDLYNYIQVNKPSSSLAQTKPEYTNLSVSNGFKVIGLFSSRQAVNYYRPFVNGNFATIRCLDQKSTRELCYGQYTGDLLFCSQHPGDTGGNDPKDYACQ